MRKRLALIQVLRHREPALLLTGQTISMFGDGVANVALTLLVVDTTGSVSKLAWFAAARMIPLVLFLLIGGAVVDRFSRRLLLLISDTARAILTGGLTLMIATHHLTFTDLLVFGFLFGLFDALFSPAMTAITPEIVDEELLPAMNALRPLSSNLMGSMIGPAVGGVLAAWSTTWAIGLDGLTFVVSALSLALMRPTPRPSRHTPSTMREDIKEGVQFVARSRWIWTTLVTVTFTNALILTPLFVLMPFFLRHNLHSSKELVGLAVAVAGASGALGALIAGNLKAPRRRIRVMWTYWCIGSLSCLIFAVATSYWEVLLVPMIVSPMALMGNVIWETMLQSDVPRELLGRVSSVDFFVSFGLSPVGLVIAGSLSGAIGVHMYYLIMAIVGTLPGLYILSSRRINEVDRDRVRRTATGGPTQETGAPVENPS